MTRSTSTLKAMLVLAGAMVALTACTADPGYDPSQFAYGYPAWEEPFGDPAYGVFGYDEWAGDWHHHDHWHGGHH